MALRVRISFNLFTLCGMVCVCVCVRTHVSVCVIGLVYAYECAGGHTSVCICGSQNSVLGVE